MTNATKTIGGAIASAIFAIALSSTGSHRGPRRRATRRFSGYLTVWAVCAVAALLAALGLLLMPRASRRTGGLTRPARGGRMAKCRHG